MAKTTGGYQTPPGTPTLEEIIKIFSIAKNFEFLGDFERDDIVIKFRVTRKECSDIGLNVNLFASAFLSETKDHLSRLSFFEELVKKYSNPDEGGVTAADCMAFIRNEKAHCPPDGVEGHMRRRLFDSVLAKLNELGEWRTFVDAERFEKARKRKEAEDAVRRAAEEAMRRQEERERRRKEQGRRSKVRPEGKWWEILGVSQNANKATIKSAWRKLAQRFHPDRQGGDPKKMAEINAAKDEGLSVASS